MRLTIPHIFIIECGLASTHDRRDLASTHDRRGLVSTHDRRGQSRDEPVVLVWRHDERGARLAPVEQDPNEERTVAKELGLVSSSVGVSLRQRRLI